ncbi:MAG TPA: hypothetical protein VIQ24_15625 [Pyrinomonadaceae bacterium]
MPRYISLAMMISLCSIMLCLVVLASPATVSSQTPLPVSREQIKELDFLIGEWKGKGGSCRPNGSCGNEISQSTKVKRGKDGLTLSINNDLRIFQGNPNPAGIGYPIILAATASVYYEEGTKLYYWRWETPAGRKNPFAARLVEPKVFQVKQEFPGSVAMVTIKVTDDGEWHERQDLWMGNKDGWVKMQETVLKKVK